MTEFERLGVSGISAAVGAGRVSAVEVARDALAKVAAYEAVQPAVWITPAASSRVIQTAG